MPLLPEGRFDDVVPGVSPDPAPDQDVLTTLSLRLRTSCTKSSYRSCQVEDEDDVGIALAFAFAFAGGVSSSGACMTWIEGRGTAALLELDEHADAVGDIFRFIFMDKTFYLTLYTFLRFYL